jgi:predicted glutamine amidotransferase
MSVGIAYTHGFCNRDGKLIMHNGIVGNTCRYAVDSFNIGHLDLLDSDGLLLDLQRRNETFANIIVIGPDERQYFVTRLHTGKLFTDGIGNYSTNEVAMINEPVNSYFASKTYSVGATWGNDSYYNTWDNNDLQEWRDWSSTYKIAK